MPVGDTGRTWNEVFNKRNMNSELTLLKFINHYTTHNRDDNGEKYSQEQSNFILTFSYSIVEKIHPKIFSENITETKIRLKSKNKENGNFVKISLSHLEKLHFKLIYNLKLMLFFERIYIWTY